MTIRIQGRSVADGNIGNVTDFTQIAADEGRIFETIGNANNLLTWIVENTNRGGNLISGGLYANPLSTSTAAANPITSLPFAINQTSEFVNGSIFTTRSTSKNYTDIYGVIRTANANTLAVEKDGALIEGTSTNILLRSEDLTDSVWSKVNVSISSNSAESPKLTTTADKIIESSSVTSFFVIQDSAQSITQGDSLTFSFYVKPNGRNAVFLRMLDEGGNFVGAKYSILNDNFSDISAGVTVKSRKVYNGWVSVCMSYTFTSAITSGFAGQCRCYLLDSGLNESYQGDGVSGVFFWGAQAEKHPFKTSYIETTTAPATRAADTVLIELLNNYIGKDQGFFTIYLKYKFLGGDGRVVSAQSSGGDDNYLIRSNGDKYFCRSGSQEDVESVSVDTKNKNSVAFVYNESGLSVYVNGIQGPVTQTTSTEVLNFVGNVYFGSNSTGGDASYGKLSLFKVFDFPLTQSQIKGLG
tara:strand:- start:248 stop:1654 length:1407 start_codon:yes stop_codon:yes gene_type:complete